MSPGSIFDRKTVLISLCAMMALMSIGNFVSNYAPGNALQTGLQDSEIVSTVSNQNDSQDLIDIVVSRPLFVTGRGIVTEPEPVAQVEAPVPIAQETVPQVIAFPNLTLLGTMISGESRFAVLRQRGRSEPIVLELGEEIETWRLQTVDAHRAVFVLGERIQEIGLWEQTMADPEMPASELQTTNPQPTSTAITPDTRRSGPSHSNGTRTRRPIGRSNDGSGG